MMNRNTKFKRILCALLCVCMVSVPVLCSVTAGAEDISSLQQQLQELEQQNQEYQDILDKTQSDIDEKEAYSDALVSKIEVLDDKIELTHQSIDKLNTEIGKKQQAIDQANADIETQMDTLKSRLRTIYMAGNASDLEIIFGAKDFSDLIDKVELVNTLSNYDKELIDGIQVKLDEISEQKAGLESDKSEIETQQASLEADQQELNELLEENEEILRTLYSTSDDAKSKLENAALESAQIEDQIQQYYEEQQKAAQAAEAKAAADAKRQQADSVASSGSSSASSGSWEDTSTSVDAPTGDGYTWPVPGFYYLSSQWNEDRYTYNHGAIDIAGGGIMGATVVAADSGTVFAVNNGCPHNWGKDGSCGCGGGYGNYVMIDHGNGKITIYAHLTNAIVGVGQSVSKGQTLGYVGSTGNSTGPHLHFECRYNGVKYNPMDEF